MVERSESVLPPGHAYGELTDRIADAVLHFPSRRQYFGLLLIWTFLTFFFVYGSWSVFLIGVGLLGLNIPIAWGFPIVNVDWWIGVAHAGSLIAAILLVLRQQWHVAVNRFVQTMSLFAAGIAGFFPILHLGRPWLAYWLIPYPSTTGVWPQWKSPLVWDGFGIGSYIGVSLLFWYVSLIPDLASMRDEAKKHWQKVLYAIFALGWRGSARHWARYRILYLLLAMLTAALAAFAHGVISLDLAATIVPGYHSTIFPLYFLAGALLSGLSMAVAVAIAIRRLMQMQDLITLRHFDLLGRAMLAAGLALSYGYLCEYFMAWYSGSPYDRHVPVVRALGHYAPAFWISLVCNVVLIHALWFKSVRTSVPSMFVLALIFLVSTWLERYTIVMTGTQQGFIPSMWDISHASPYDPVILLGSVGVFGLLTALLLRIVPVLSLHDLRSLFRRTGQER